MVRHIEVARVVSAWEGGDGTLMVVIPAEARNKLGIKAKDKFLVKYDTEEKVLIYEMLRSKKGLERQ